MLLKKVLRGFRIAQAEISRAGEVARAEISRAAEVARAHSIKESPESVPDYPGRDHGPEKVPAQRSRGPRKLPVLILLKKVPGAVGRAQSSLLCTLTSWSKLVRPICVD